MHSKGTQTTDLLNLESSLVQKRSVNGELSGTAARYHGVVSTEYSSNVGHGRGGFYSQGLDSQKNSRRLGCQCLL
jgi:hypothetical protein